MVLWSNLPLLSFFSAECAINIAACKSGGHHRPKNGNNRVIADVLESAERTCRIQIGLNLYGIGHSYFTKLDARLSF
jgi:hypothetical protein